MRVGPLSGVCIESLTYSFEMVAESNNVAGAILNITATTAQVICQSCGTEYAVPTLDQVCPSCQSINRRVVSGDEFTIDSIKVERESSHV